MPLKEVLVDRDVLDRDDSPARLELSDRVDERRRVAEAEPVEIAGKTQDRADPFTSLASRVSRLRRSA